LVKPGVNLQCVIDASVPPVVLGDPHRIKQILVNLVRRRIDALSDTFDDQLGNANKFTSSGRISLTATLAPLLEDTGQVVVDIEKDESHLRLVLEVEDTGPGMTPEVVDRLFEPYRQASASVARQYGGSGLGLAIVKRLLLAMNGTIAVKSELGKGSTFTVKIPCTLAPVNLDLTVGAKPSPETETAAPAAPASEALAKTQQKLRILLADDSIVNRKLLQRILTKAGHAVTGVNDGQEAVDAVMARHGTAEAFDVIVLDVHMPVHVAAVLCRSCQRLPAIGGR